VRPVNRDKFNVLRRPDPKSEEPIMPSVGTYEMARMISKKTKFRVLDVKEVLDEVGPCIYGILLQRKSVNFDGITIRSAWNRFRFPRFIRFESSNDNNGYWAFGYLLPKIEFEKQMEMMYAGAVGAFPKKFLDKIRAYVPSFLETAEDIRQYSLDMMAETGQLGKETCVDKEGYTIPMPPRRKKYKFNPDFHPTWIERFRYRMLRRRLLSEYHARKYTDDPLPFSHVWKGLQEANIFNRDNVQDNMIIPDVEEEEEN
jgi:hypothetical protein